MRTAGFRRACAFVVLTLVAATAWAQQGSQAPQGNLQGFSVVLVVGDLQGGATADNIPAAARAALGDLKDFLPYRSYRVLDTSWILGSTSQLFRATTQLRGDQQTYEVSLTSSPVGAPAPPSLQMKFVMREGGLDPQLRGLNPEHPDVLAYRRRMERDAQLRAELLQLQASRAALEKELQNSNVPGSPEDRKAQNAAGQAQLQDLRMAIDTKQYELNGLRSSSGQTLIDTSFNMRIGETVVVGTSRVRGDKALIALLTAVRK